MSENIYSHHTCVCGYSYKKIFINKYMYDTEVVEGEDEFISISGNFTAKNPDSMYSEGSVYNIHLIACPVCGTVKMT